MTNPTSAAESPANPSTAAAQPTPAAPLPQVLQNIRARSADPYPEVYVICGPAARNDVIRIIASMGSQLGIHVMPLSAFMQHISHNLYPRTRLPKSVVRRHVARFLNEEESEFSAAELHQEPATLEALTDIVWRLLDIPADQATRHGGRKLAQICAQIAEHIRQSTAAEHFTNADIIAAVPRFAEEHPVITVDLIDPRPYVMDSLAGAIPATIAPAALDPELQQTISADSFPDEDAEAVAVARHIRALAAPTDGSQPVELHRIAVAGADPANLERTVRTLENSGISVASAATKPAAELPLVRAFIELATIDPAEFPRRHLSALIATGKVKGLPKLTQFDRLTRQTTVIHSGTDWDLALTAANQESESSTDQDTRAALQSLIQLRSRLQELWGSSSWAQLVATMQSIVGTYLVPDHNMPLLHAAFAEISSLDGAPMHGAKQAIVANILADLYDRPVGEGLRGHVVVGDLETLVGRNLEHAFLTGLHEAALPGTFTSDAAITPEQSGLTPKNYTNYRLLLWDAARHSARHVHCSYSRTSIARQPSRLPSQWLNRWIAESPGGEITRRGDLTAELLADGTVPLNEAEQQLALALSGDAEHPNSAFATAMQQREGGIADRYNGFIDHAAMQKVARELWEKPSSASALESYAYSPLEFFIKRILDGWLLEDRETSTSIDPRDRGTIYHRIFEEWTRRVWLDADPRPVQGSDIDWDAARQTLDEVITQQLELHSSGQYSTFSVRELEQEIRSACEVWFEQQKQDALSGWVPIGAELEFGSAEDFRITLDSGQQLYFKGSIDRIDYRPASAAPNSVAEIRVTDYKSGKPDSSTNKKKYGNVKDGTPLGISAAAATTDEYLCLQLALYGAAVVGEEISGGAACDTATVFAPAPRIKSLIDAIAPAEKIAVSARYLFFLHAKEVVDESDELNEYEKLGGRITYNRDAADQLRRTLEKIVSHIEHGRFPVYHHDTFRTSQEFMRLGAANYERFAAELVKQAAVPLDISPQSAEETPDADPAQN